MREIEPAITLAYKVGYRAVLLDLDDTLVRTSDLIAAKKESYFGQIGTAPSIPIGEVRRRFRELDNQAFEVMSVQKTRWAFVSDQLAKEFGHRQVFCDALPVLDEIYTTVPPMIEGATVILRALAASKMKIGLVTHGEEEWSKMKVNKLPVEFDYVRIVDAKGFKTAKDWQTACDRLGEIPVNAIVVGDSKRNDIIPGCSLGAGGILLPMVWDVYGKGEMPKRAVEIKHITDFFEGMRRLVELEN